LQIELRLSGDAVDGGERLRVALGALAVEHFQVCGDRVSLQCQRHDKMALLERVAALDGRVLDLHVREPSLEDVFLGYAG
jgi:Cu-processing system ATP-binding protein